MEVIIHNIFCFLLIILNVSCSSDMFVMIYVTAIIPICPTSDEHKPNLSLHNRTHEITHHICLKTLHKLPGKWTSNVSCVCPLYRSVLMTMTFMTYWPWLWWWPWWPWWPKQPWWQSWPWWPSRPWWPSPLWWTWWLWWPSWPWWPFDHDDDLDHDDYIDHEDHLNSTISTMM